MAHLLPSVIDPSQPFAWPQRVSELVLLRESINPCQLHVINEPTYFRQKIFGIVAGIDYELDGPHSRLGAGGHHSSGRCVRRHGFDGRWRSGSGRLGGRPCSFVDGGGDAGPPGSK